MARSGDSKFERILKDSGGYVLYDDFIKFIISNKPPNGMAYRIKYNEIVMEFGIIKEKLKTRLHIYIYEPATNKGFIARNIKYAGFYGKVYEVINKEVTKRTNQLHCFHIVLDETK